MTARSTAPEPQRWPLRRTPLARLRRAVTVPIAAGAVVFIAIVLFSILTVWLRPNAAADTGEATAATPSTGTVDLVDPGLAGSAAEDANPEQVGPSAPSGASIFVHVVGEVREPGVYELRAGDRVEAAVESAGGATEAAVLSGINLARPLVDGEQLLVPDADQVAAGVGESGVAAAPDAVSGSTGSSLVDLNRADASQLESLPRIGPSLAQRIIDWRETNGGFTRPEQLLEVSGIGRKTLEQLLPLVTV